MVGGGLVQLIAQGATNHFLTCGTTDPHCYNHRDAMMHWFVDRDDGFATQEDMVTVSNAPSILSAEGSIVPFSVREERARSSELLL
jgi:hypothetical protein